MLNDNDDHSDLENEGTVRFLMAPHITRLNSQLTEQDGNLVRAKVYRFHALLADQFKKGRIFLLGDAAHQMPPFLGQGLCSGIRDAYNLSWKLAGVLAGQWDAKVLDSYHSERHPHVEEVINLAITHGDIIQTRNPFKALARDIFLMLGRVFPFIISTIKFGQQWRLGNGVFARDHRSLNRYMLRQSIIKLNSGEEVLLDSLLGDSFALIGFNADPTVLLSQQNTDFLNTAVTNVTLGEGGQGIDKEGLLQHWADDNEVALALLRPDRQIYGLCYGHSHNSLKDQLNKLFDQLKDQLS
jgi:3-(3-hydroxy-phenyl)propionate hydroxylase